MDNKFNYTNFARKIALRFPTFSHISIQVNFWIFSFLLLSTMIHLNTLTTIESYSLQIPTSFSPSVLMSFIAGIIYGVALGFIDIWIEKGFLRHKALGVIILFRILVYLLIIIGMTTFTRYVLWEKLVLPHFFEENIPYSNHITWKYFFYLLLIYTFAMSIVINFINQMNKKFGPGVLIPMLLGRYRNPREEQRIFMFMDLQSSTTHAENLGHIKYSALIRDSFMDINQVLAKHNAEVYQYVGDEVVISWSIAGNLSDLTCVEFFFACQDQFGKRTDYYMENYGVVPLFKAGIHLGTVTAVEVGEIKRDIAYHGDTLNTASRIQSVCNQYDKIFLVSGDIKEFADLDKNYSVELIGDINLRGKTESIDVYSVERKLT